MDTMLLILTDNFWIAAAMIASVTTYLTSIINNKIHPNKVCKQIISWLISILLTVICFSVKLITIKNATWPTIAVTGIVVGLASNGMYDMKSMRKMITDWFNNILENTNSKSHQTK